METQTHERAPGQFPKVCTGCRKETLTETAWNQLPLPANGRKYAMGLEWRNHGCGGTLAVRLVGGEED
jgi:hypothetical protein